MDALSKLYREADRGSRAKALMEDPIFQESFAAVQQDIFDTFAATDPSDGQKLLECRLMLKMHAELFRKLKTELDSGKLANHQLQQLKTKG